MLDLRWNRSSRLRVPAGRLGIVTLQGGGPAWADSGYVFTNEDGQPVGTEAVDHRFRRMTKAAGVPKIRLHDLRHTHASLMLKAGVPVHVVSRRLGHASAALTLSVYSHVLPAQQAKAAAAFSALVDGAR